MGDELDGLQLRSGCRAAGIEYNHLLPDVSASANGGADTRQPGSGQFQVRDQCERAIVIPPRASLDSEHHKPAACGLALVRVTIGAMFVWVFFENLGKGLYTPAGYAGLISYYIKASHAPAVWKAVMSLVASHAALAAPLQGLTEISL